MRRPECSVSDLEAAVTASWWSMKSGDARATNTAVRHGTKIVDVWAESGVAAGRLEDLLVDSEELFAWLRLSARACACRSPRPCSRRGAARSIAPAGVAAGGHAVPERQTPGSRDGSDGSVYCRPVVDHAAGPFRHRRS